jgi:CBS domain-containing protein
MTTVKQVLDNKGHDLHAIRPDTSVFDALRLMAEHNIGSLVVLEDGDLVGIITERHYARGRIERANLRENSRQGDYGG